MYELLYWFIPCWELNPGSTTELHTQVQFFFLSSFFFLCQTQRGSKQSWVFSYQPKKQTWSICPVPGNVTVAEDGMTRRS